MEKSKADVYGRIDLCMDGRLVRLPYLSCPTEDSWNSATLVMITSGLSYGWRGNDFQCVPVD